MTDAERRSGTSFRVLRNRDFAVFWSAALVSNTGSWMQTIAVPFVVFQMTKSTAWLGFAAFMNFVPAMIAGPFGGSYADRHSRKRILLVTQTMMMMLAFALWGIWVAGVATPGLIVGIVFVSGFVGGVNITTWQAFVTQLVDEHELVDAVRLNSMQFMGARAFGPAIAGFVLAYSGAAAAFLLNGVSFLLVLGALVVVHPRPQEYSGDTGHVLVHLREGWRVMRARTSLYLPTLMIGIVSLLGTSVIQLAPAMAKDMFDVGRGKYGLLVAAFGLGAVTGSVVIAFIADRMLRSFVASVGIVGLAAGVMALGLAPVYAVGVAAMFFMGLTYLLLATSLNTGVQARVEDEFRARVMAIYLSSLLLGVPLGALVQGKAAELVDLRVVIVVSGALLLAFGVYTMVRYARLRPLDESLVAVEITGELGLPPAVAGAD
ncbi:MAG: MFS transporter [Actinobacteria bacterium]|nr:MFS transporter [Actinomycetota bacterium]